MTTPGSLNTCVPLSSKKIHSIGFLWLVKVCLVESILHSDLNFIVWLTCCQHHRTIVFFQDVRFFASQAATMCASPLCSCDYAGYHEHNDISRIIL